MPNWNPKPLRPAAENPLFTENQGYTITKSQSLSPMERQRLADGTPHTKTGRTGLRPPLVQRVGDEPELYLGKSVNEDDKDADEVQKSLNPDLIVKSYLGQDGEDTEKGEGDSLGTKAGKVAVGAAKVGARAAGSVARTAVGLASQR